MSCTENESGPFVVFFLPAVVGCLTILLARRLANSQVASGSTTAVSRRRKIIKDPLVKRPLPPIACKMLPPSSKKTNGAPKKGVSPTTEEDLNGSKRVGRPAKLSPSSSPNGSAEVKFPQEPMPPKHIPYPHIPQDGELLFESMTFVFMLVAMGLQFLNLYRSVWWLPHSYTHQAMNFYLIDPHLVAFIVTMISRRLLLSITLALLRAFLAPKLIPHATVAARMFILGVIMGGLAWCTYFIALKYPLVKLFYLCYPAVIYLLLFGFQVGPFLELNHTETPLMHCCSHDPRQIRAEVDVFRQDFNLRVKKIIFNSVMGAYYTSFIPCCFAQPYLYYCARTAGAQTLCVWAALGARLAAHALAPHCDAPHRAALHLGLWRRRTSTGTDTGSAEQPQPAGWCGAARWARGSRVSLAGVVYVCVEPGAAVPALDQHRRFYMLFKNPSTLLCALLCLQIALILIQLCLLFSSIPWHGFLGIFLLLFINYYTMFRLAREYLVAWKVYKAESIIQDKNNANPVT